MSVCAAIETELSEICEVAPARLLSLLTEEILEKVTCWSKVLFHCPFLHRIILETRLRHARTLTDGIEWAINEDKISRLEDVVILSLIWQQILKDEPVWWGRFAFIGSDPTKTEES